MTMLTTVKSRIASTITTRPVGPRISRLRRWGAGCVGGAGVLTAPSSARVQRPLTGYRDRPTSARGPSSDPEVGCLAEPAARAPAGPTPPRPELHVRALLPPQRITMPPTSARLTTSRPSTSRPSSATASRWVKNGSRCRPTSHSSLSLPRTPALADPLDLACIRQAPLVGSVRGTYLLEAQEFQSALTTRPGYARPSGHAGSHLHRCGQLH